MSRVNIPLVPKEPDGPLRVLILGRVSTDRQDLENIEASYAFDEKFLGESYQGPLYLKRLGERGSGLRTDRPTIVEAEDEIATGTWDLVLMEDLSRAYRNPRHQMAFVQNAVDAGTRVICIGDGLDTADPNWEVMLGAAALRHGMFIPDTRRRVKRTAAHAFDRGGMVQKVRYGYRKLGREEAEAGESGPKGLRIARVAECTPVIEEMARRVLAGESYEEVATYLFESGVAAGPYVESGVWSGRVVEALLRSPILHGERVFGVSRIRTKFSTGKKTPERSPTPPATKHYPELAHLSAERHAELLRVMDLRAPAGASKGGPGHPLRGKPRSQAPWPAQHPRCAICESTMYRTGLYLKCGDYFLPGGRKACWNHVQVRSDEVRARVLSWVLEHCGRHPSYRSALAGAAWSEFCARRSKQGRADRALDEEIHALEARAKNLARAIGSGGELESLVGELRRVEKALGEARGRRAKAAASAAGPVSRAEVEAELDRAVAELAGTSCEFAALMRRVIPEFVIVPVQALDCGQVRPRGRLTLRLSGLLAGAGGRGAVEEEVARATLDLFTPPAHIRAIPACLEARRADPGATLARIGEATGLGRMTVKRAFRYARLMEEAGQSDPYRELTSRPASAARWH